MSNSHLSALNHITEDERYALSLVDQIGPGPAVVVGSSLVDGGFSRDFIATLHPQVLLAAYRTTEPGELRDRLLDSLLATDDPLVDWYAVLRELCQPRPNALVIEGYDGGGTPEPRRGDPRRVKIYDRLGLPDAVRRDWEALLTGNTGENPQPLVNRLVGCVAESAAGAALLLSQLNTGPSSRAGAILSHLATNQGTGASPVEILLGIYAQRPWPDSSCILVAAISYCANRLQLKQIIRAGNGNVALVRAATEAWAKLPEQQPTSVRTNPPVPKM